MPKTHLDKFAAVTDWCGKLVFCAIVILKRSFLPRQTRDKHRENSKKRRDFCRRRRRYLAMVNYMDDAVVRNNAFLEPFSIYQHRLRTSTAETEEKEGVFCRRAWWAR